MRSAVLRRLARLSVRLRVTLAYTAVMAVLLAATGLFLHARLGSALNDALDRGLDERSDDIAALLVRAAEDPSAPGPGPLSSSGERLAQLVSPSGTVLDTTRALGDGALLSADEVARARRGLVRFTHHLGREKVRLVARPVRVAGQRDVLVVGASARPDEDAQEQLGGLLLIGLPIALLLAGLAGYGAVAGALRPVELMRRRAQTITAGRPDRLPVPPTHDEIAALGRTLNDMLDRLEHAYARERRFVADASHELRTPLSIIRGELELAMRDARTAEEFREAVSSATEETERLVRLAEDLLVITRADQGRLPVRRAEVDVGDLLDGVARRFAGLARDADVAIAVESPPAQKVVDGDRMLLEQALGNLVDNALRHAHGTVTIAMDEGALCVRDDGPGFDDVFLAEAFDRFARAEPDRARDSGGAGLGLAIVAAIAEAHGGAASARNVPGGGAEVRFTVA